MSLENALNNLTDELRRRRNTADTGSGGWDSSTGDSEHSDCIDHYDDDYEHDDHHGDCIDADGDGHCDSDDND